MSPERLWLKGISLSCTDDFRASAFGLPVNWIAAHIVRIKDGVLVEHWDVIQDEATQEQSKSGQPMFGHTFATYASAR
jgi:hypothetical protein